MATLAGNVEEYYNLTAEEEALLFELDAQLAAPATTSRRVVGLSDINTVEQNASKADSAGRLGDAFAVDAAVLVGAITGTSQVNGSFPGLSGGKDVAQTD